MVDIKLGTGYTVSLDVPKGATGRSTVQAVADGLGLMPGQTQVATVETAETEAVSDPVEPDATQQNTQGEPAEGAPQPTRLDLKAYQDQLVEVQVDGEKVLKRLGDVVGGYMRQADYTRKTQQLAEQRRQLEEGIPQQDRQLLELGRTVASNPQARQVVQEVLGQSEEPPDAETRVTQLEARLDEQQRVAAAQAQLESLVVQHPEAQAHLKDVVSEMRRTGSRDPISTWRAMDYSNVPERLVDAAEAERLRRAEAATAQSVVNEPSSASSGAVSAEEIPIRDSNGQPLSGRDFVKSLMNKLAAA